MKRWTIPEMTDLVQRGVGKVALYGPRGATLVSMEEIEAMAAMLAILGVRPIEPGTYLPPSKIPHTEGERA